MCLVVGCGHFIIHSQHLTINKVENIIFYEYYAIMRAAGMCVDG